MIGRAGSVEAALAGRVEGHQARMLWRANGKRSLYLEQANPRNRAPEPRTQRSGVSGNILTPSAAYSARCARCVPGSDWRSAAQARA